MNFRKYQKYNFPNYKRIHSDFILYFIFQDDGEGEAFDLSKMDRENEEGDEEMANVKVHEIKFDQYGVMVDGVDESTDAQLAKLKGEEIYYKPIY